MWSVVYLSNQCYKLIKKQPKNGTFCIYLINNVNISPNAAQVHIVYNGFWPG